MYTQVFDAVALDVGTTTEVSKAVLVPGGFTTAQVDAVIYEMFANTPPQVEFELQQANDKGDWEVIPGSVFTLGHVGYSQGNPVPGLTAGIVRLRLTLTGFNAVAIVSAGFSLARA
jgi:hypothetical protein